MRPGLTKPPSQPVAQVFGAACGWPNCASAGAANATTATAESMTAAFMVLRLPVLQVGKAGSSGTDLRERPDRARRQGARPARQHALFDIEIRVMMFPRL